MADTGEMTSATITSERSGAVRNAGGNAVAAPSARVGQAAQGRAVGYASTNHALLYSDQLVLNERQAAVYDRLAPIALQRLLVAQEQGQDEFVLMSDWEWPDLLRGLGYRSANIVGNVREGLMPTWHALEALLERHGYRVVKAAQPWRLIARR